MSGHDLAVWGVGTARCLRAHWMLKEFGLDYELHPIQARTGETKTDAFLKLNPKHKIPVLRHGSLVLSESAAILGYLSETFEPPADFYVPQDAAGRSKLNEWCYFAMTELDAHPLYVIRRHDALKHVYGEAPAAVESAREYFLEQINAVAGRVGGEGQYLMGDGLSVADILMTTCLDWAASYDLPLPDPVGQYHDRLRQRPAYHDAYKVTYPDR